MRPGWHVILRTVAVTFVATTALWFGLAGWWYASLKPSRSEPPENKVAGAFEPVAMQDPTKPPLRRAQIAQIDNMRIPVTGVQFAQLADTFGDGRDNGLRRHDALDIMAPRGTPVVSAAAGRVEKLFWSEAGGKTVYVRSPDGQRMFYYAHLDSYDPSLREGQQVSPGTPLGVVGATGNADPNAPHLHFAVWATSPSAKWSDDATPLNPYDLLNPRQR